MTWLHALRRDGFARIEGVLSPGEVAALARDFDRMVARARTLDGPAEVDGAWFAVEPAPFRLHRVVWCGAVSPAAARLGGDPRFVGIAARALGSDRVVQLIQQAHFKLPGDEVAFGWHQDASNRRYGTPLWRDVDGRGSFVQIAVAVDPMTPERGGLRMIRGSHRAGFVADPRTGVVPAEHVRAADAVDVVLAPGDAAVFGPFTVHGSGPNRSSAPRRVFLQGYALPGANRRVYPGCGVGVLRSAAGQAGGASRRAASSARARSKRARTSR